MCMPRADWGVPHGLACGSHGSGDLSPWPREPMITEVTEQLKRLNLSKTDTVILDLLSDAGFMGTDAGGLPSEAVRAEGGRYHI